GGIVLIEGLAGVGKTRLLRETATKANGAGAVVLQARGSELEHDFAFGVVRQLFEPLLRKARPERLARLLRGTTEAARSALFAEPPTLATVAGATALFGVFLSV